jgi:hypothetical protein
LEDLLPVLVVLFLIVGPLIEKMLKAGRQAGQPPQPPKQRRTQPAERQRLPDGRTTTASRPAEEQDTRDAADLLPAELWEILTGQKRQEPQPQPQERPEPEAERRPAPVKTVRKSMAERRAEVERKRAQRVAAQRGEAPSAEDAAVTDLMRRRDREQATRRSYDHAAPIVVSLETEPASEQVRHAAFHAKLDRLPRAPRRRQSAIASLDLDIEDRAALQRAILIQEVLGRPKGLD